MNKLLVALLSMAALGGCASSTSSNVYSRNQIMTAWDVEYGSVIGIKEVTIEGERSGLGAAGGGYIGYETGRAVVNGSGRGVAGAVGGVAGAVAGRAVEEGLTREKGLQITIELEGHKQEVSIVQGADQQFAVGERVKVLRRGDGAARVTKA
jgi:outer membrane lipoprotein SlyB